MPQLPRLPIDSQAVTRQFARRAPLDAPQFLYGEIAQRMLRRLSYIRIAPHDILDAGCGAAHALDPLRARYPDQRYIGLDGHPDTYQVLQEWRHTLRNDDLAMYSSLGPGTFRELRNALAEADLDTRPMEFVDMHDFGDLMLQVGFADPVMDQEIITLTY